jgi:hypothetical protein
MTSATIGGLRAQPDVGGGPSAWMFRPRRGVVQRCGDHTCPASECVGQEPEETLRRRGGEGGGFEAPPVVQNALRSQGTPIEAPIRERFESALGHDFSHVRIHVDGSAAESASAIGAVAYTVGGDVVFGAGRYAPETELGRRLLAHELVHVAQQSAASPTGSTRLTVGSAADPAEAEADRLAEQPTSGISGTASAIPVGVIQRQSGLPGIGGLEPQCSVDWQAVWEGRFDVGQHLKCCAKLPVIGAGCSTDLIDLIKKAQGVGGSRPAQTPPPTLGCSVERRTPFGTCCPEGKAWTGSQCEAQTRRLCLPWEQAPTGECCPPGQQWDFLQHKCQLPVSRPAPDRPPAPTPSTTRILFRKDRPEEAASGTSALASNVTSEGQNSFDALVAELEANPALHVMLVGRASPEGTDEYNMRLRARRAQAVSQALTDAGVSSPRLADASMSPLGSGCESIRTGLATCGKIGSTGPEDRVVQAVEFVPLPAP